MKCLFTYPNTPIITQNAARKLFAVPFQRLHRIVQIYVKQSRFTQLSYRFVIPTIDHSIQ